MSSFQEAKIIIKNNSGSLRNQTLYIISELSPKCLKDLGIFNWYFTFLKFKKIFLLEINPLSVSFFFASIFSHPGGCRQPCLLLLIVYFAVQKLLSLIKAPFAYFCLYFHYLDGESKKILLWFMSKSVMPMFSFKNFIVSGLIFRSLIHLSLLLHKVLESFLTI